MKLPLRAWTNAFEPHRGVERRDGPRDTAAASLRLFASTGLLKLAAPGLDVPDAKNADLVDNAHMEVAFELVSRLDSIDAGGRMEYHQKSVPSNFTTLRLFLPRAADLRPHL
jgi:hypothetical protein